MSPLLKTRTLPCAVDAARLDQRVLGLAAIGAAVHAQRAADRARNAAEEGEPGDRRLLRGTADLHVGHRGAGADAIARLDLDLAEAAAEPDDHAGHAAVAHDQVGAEPDHGDGNLGRQVLRGNTRGRASSSGMNSTCAGPPTRNQVSSASDWFGSSRPRSSGTFVLRSGTMSANINTAISHKSEYKLLRIIRGATRGAL